MGTYYLISAAPQCNSDVLQRAESDLFTVNDAMSTYLAESALMRLNATPVDQWLEVGEDVVAVLQLAEQTRRLSGGAFDVSVGALVRAWGFGAQAAETPPTPAEIRLLMPPDGERYRLDGTRAARLADVFLDLSALAKGFAVGKAAGTLRDGGCADFMVDVGGEVYVAGHNPHGQPWRIGIEVPRFDAREVHRVLALRDRAVATSGDYRNYREVDGRRVSHTIDPRSGAPIEHRLASVTVVHRDAALADAYATAISVMGGEQGFAWAERENLAAYLIVRAADDFEVRYTAAMASYLAPQ